MPITLSISSEKIAKFFTRISATYNGSYQPIKLLKKSDLVGDQDNLGLIARGKFTKINDLITPTTTTATKEQNRHNYYEQIIKFFEKNEITDKNLIRYFLHHLSDSHSIFGEIETLALFVDAAYKKEIFLAQSHNTNKDPSHYLENTKYYLENTNDALIFSIALTAEKSPGIFTEYGKISFEFHPITHLDYKPEIKKIYFTLNTNIVHISESANDSDIFLKDYYELFRDLESIDETSPQIWQYIKAQEDIVNSELSRIFSKKDRNDAFLSKFITDHKRDLQEIIFKHFLDENIEEKIKACKKMFFLMLSTVLTDKSTENKKINQLLLAQYTAPGQPIILTDANYEFATLKHKIKTSWVEKYEDYKKAHCITEKSPLMWQMAKKEEDTISNIANDFSEVLTYKKALSAAVFETFKLKTFRFNQEVLTENLNQATHDFCKDMHRFKPTTKRDVLSTLATLLAPFTLYGIYAIYRYHQKYDTYWLFSKTPEEINFRDAISQKVTTLNTEKAPPSEFETFLGYVNNNNDIYNDNDINHDDDKLNEKSPLVTHAVIPTSVAPVEIEMIEVSNFPKPHPIISEEVIEMEVFSQTNTPVTIAIDDELSFLPEESPRKMYSAPPSALGLAEISGTADNPFSHSRSEENIASIVSAISTPVQTMRIEAAAPIETSYAKMSIELTPINNVKPKPRQSISINTDSENVNPNTNPNRRVTLLSLPAARTTAPATTFISSLFAPQNTENKYKTRLADIPTVCVDSTEMLQGSFPTSTFVV